jgi:predicted acyltransferase
MRFRDAFSLSTEQRLANAGVFLLFIGLLLEPYEGGIKKDPSTFSYYFITAGYGCWGVLLLLDFATNKLFNLVSKFFEALGRNPLVAYATGSLLILPVLSIFGWRSVWDSWATTPLLGFLKGLIFTFLVSGVTILFNRYRLFWRS